MQDTFINFINDYGYIGIALLILIESVFPPIPSEIVLLFGGFITTYANMIPTLVIASATIGSVLGALILYLVGRILNKDRLKLILSGKTGKVLRLKPTDIDKADHWFSKYKYNAVFLCRCVPIVRSLISIPAGIDKMRIFPFLSLTLLGSAIWNTLLVLLGAFSGDAWEQNLKYFGWYSKAALAVMVVFAVLFLIFAIRKTKSRKERENNDSE